MAETVIIAKVSGHLLTVTHNADTRRVVYPTHFEARHMADKLTTDPKIAAQWVCASGWSDPVA